MKNIMYLINEKNFISNEPIYIKLSNSDNSMFISRFFYFVIIDLFFCLI
jgi:hypothetical protein